MAILLLVSERIDFAVLALREGELRFAITFVL